VLGSVSRRRTKEIVGDTFHRFLYGLHLLDSFVYLFHDLSIELVEHVTNILTFTACFENVLLVEEEMLKHNVDVETA
jgi:hypothetical protein